LAKGTSRGNLGDFSSKWGLRQIFSKIVGESVLTRSFFSDWVLTFSQGDAVMIKLYHTEVDIYFT
jgi:hypothetical protein